MKRRAFMAAGVSITGALAGCSRPDEAEGEDRDAAENDPDHEDYTEEEYPEDGEEPIDDYTSD